MKFGVPWSVEGVPAETRETAIEAARRSGMSPAEWLNSTIIRQASHQGVRAHSRGRQDDDGNLAAVNERIDSLSRRIERLMRTGPEAYAPSSSTDEPEQIADLVGPLDHRPDPNASRSNMTPAVPTGVPVSSVPLLSSLDRAVAEFAARQRALNGNSAAPARQSSPGSPAAPIPAASIPRDQAPASVSGAASASPPSQNLSGLEHQLRDITDQIKALRSPNVERAIDALRGELSEIGHSLNEALPRQTLEAIERQIHDLSRRVAEGRQAGIDSSALTGIEDCLTEVRDALRGLTPVENLAGCNEAIADVGRKIDLIVDHRSPESLAQLENAISALRGITSNIASNDSIDSLAIQVHALSEKIDQIALVGTDENTLSTLGQRIATLSDALTERTQTGITVPPRIEALVDSLTDKIERMEDSRDLSDALGRLEDRIVAVVAKLDASDSRLSNLEAIERGLTDLMVNIEDLKKHSGAPRADHAAQRIEELKSDIGRTQDTLDAVHAMLDLVVDRLGTIERDIRSDARAPTSSENGMFEQSFRKSPPTDNALLELLTGPPDAHPQIPRPQPNAQPPAYSAVQRRLPTTDRPPIDPELPPNQPLEPGSGSPQPRTIHAVRIAASQADLGVTRRPVSDHDAKSSFIAAARRAAQAAAQQPGNRAARAQPGEATKTARLTLRNKIVRPVKSLFIAASVIACVIGSIQIVGPVLERAHISGAKTAKITGADKRSSDTQSGMVSTDTDTDEANQPEAPGELAVNVLAPPQQSGDIPIIPPAGSLSTDAPGKSVEGVVPILNPPMLETKSDVTGSVSGTSGENGPASPQPKAAPQRDELPDAIAGKQLRSAAAAGDPTAAFEIAARFAAGRGVPTNSEEAAHWFERAASKGLAPAQFRYASMLEKGIGVKKDLNKARQLYIAAAAQGNAKAMHNLAVLFAEGIDGKPDYPSAAKWFRKAADRGISDSQYNLGVLTARGLGVESEMADSYKWFALAAAHGDHEAAKKRDEVAARLGATALAAAKQAVATFKPMPQPEAAVKVPSPPGGWDHAKTAPASKSRPQSTGGPLALDTFAAGKR